MKRDTHFGSPRGADAAVGIPSEPGRPRPGFPVPQHTGVFGTCSLVRESFLAPSAAGIPSRGTGSRENLFPPNTRRPAARRLNDRGRRGAVLLEVIVAMGLLLFGMAAVGMQVRSGLDVARTVNTGTRALMLVDTIWAELDAGVIRPGKNDDEVKGDFGVTYPGYTWRFEIEPCDIEEFYMLTLDVGYNFEAVGRQIEDPSYEIDIEDTGTRIIRTVYRLYPKPADINLEDDFGLTQEDLANLMGTGGEAGGQQDGPGGGESADQGGGAGGIGGLAALAEQMGIDLTSFDFLFDPSGFNPRMLTELPPEDFAQLAELLETLLRQGGGAMSNLQNQMGGDNRRNLFGEGRRRADERRRGEEGGGEGVEADTGGGRQMGRDRGQDSGEESTQGDRADRRGNRREGLTRQRGRDRGSDPNEGGVRGRQDRGNDRAPGGRDTRQEEQDRRGGRQGGNQGRR